MHRESGRRAIEPITFPCRVDTLRVMSQRRLITKLVHSQTQDYPTNLKECMCVYVVYANMKISFLIILVTNSYVIPLYG